MNKLTAEKCREMFLNLFEDKRQDGITMKEDLYMQALEIALPILEQRERGECDWIEWSGGDTCPVPNDAKAEIKFRDGDSAELDTWLDILEWRHKGYGSDIIAYRLVK